MYLRWHSILKDIVLVCVQPIQCNQNRLPFKLVVFSHQYIFYYHLTFHLLHHVKDFLMIPPAIIIVFHFSRSYCVLNCGNVCRQRIGTKRNVQGCRENWLKWRSYSKNATIFFMFFNHIMVRRSACLTLGAQVFYSIKMSLYQLYNHYIIITLETWKIKYISFIH